ncbi:low molecular weight protein-tyrosine-phosphatase [Moraxella sp. ZY200743]|uniref:low molecular weight protein-tyrosine-phosphatase n=1 Tax=Moraxella sp. ZY200743 TaxID=2911970 RepID=UPI003D7C949F
MYPTSILFVCLGNICRSPTAEAVMAKHAKKQGLDIRFDSAGVASYHIGSPPDERAITTGNQQGYDLSTLRARQVQQHDFYDFDIIFAMDHNNLKDLQKIMPSDATAQVTMFDDVAVADPYYGDMSDFKSMLKHIEQVSHRWLDRWQQEVNHDRNNA